MKFNNRSKNCNLTPSQIVSAEHCSLKTELDEVWLNSHQAAAFLGLTVQALNNRVNRGSIIHYKLGRSNRFRKSELEQLLLKERRGKYGI